MKYAQIAQEVLRLEANELLGATKNLDEQFDYVVKRVLQTTGKVVILGVGKSGLIGSKIAATLASTGTSSFFIHPTEAMYGDLGMVDKSDLVIAISYSGESEELVEIVPHLRRFGVPIVAMTSNRASSLATSSDFVLSIAVEKEACPLNIAPTSSTTLTLVLGDALAISLMRARDFSKEDFACFHPGGKIGKRLFVKAEDFLQTQNLPIVPLGTSLKEAIVEMSSGMLGTLLVVDKNERLVGMLSDGDFRRMMMREDFSFEKPIETYMTTTPKTCTDTNILAIDALKIIEKYKIQVLIFVNQDNQILGTLHIHTLLKAGI